MPTMWSNDRIFYAAGKDALKDTESVAASDPKGTTDERPEADKAEPPLRETLRGLIGRILDPHLLPEDDDDIKTPISRR